MPHPGQGVTQLPLTAVSRHRATESLPGHDRGPRLIGIGQVVNYDAARTDPSATADGVTHL